MHAYPRSVVDDFVAALQLLLQHGDPESALRTGLTQLIKVSNAEGGALCFGVGSRPITLRQGIIPPSIMTIVERAERALLARLRQGPVSATTPHHITLRSNRRVVGLPLKRYESVVGYCSLIFKQEQVLDDEMLAYVHTIAGLLGTIASLLQELDHTQAQLERVGFLHEIGQALTSTLDLSQLLRDTMQLATEVMEAQASSLMLIDQETNELVYEIVHGSKRDQLHQFRMPMTVGIAGRVATTGEAIIVNDPARNPWFNRKVDERTGFLTRNILCVPLEIKGRIIGVLQVLNKRSDIGFTREDLDLMRTLASQAAIAIENARLYRDLQEERDRIIQAQENVRRELARDLHDGTTQLLSALSMNIEHAQTLLDHAPELVRPELDSMKQLADRAIRETRTLLFELRPVVLETQGLVPALESYVARLNEHEGPGARVVLESPAELPQLPSKVERTLFGIIQEAITNARKHAEADRIQVGIYLTENAIEVLIVDDGLGFDLQRTQAGYDRSGSLGLLNMRERAELINATLSIESSPNGGTRVRVLVPNPPDAAETSL